MRYLITTFLITLLLSACSTHSNTNATPGGGGTKEPVKEQKH